MTLPFAGFLESKRRVGFHRTSVNNWTSKPQARRMAAMHHIEMCSPMMIPGECNSPVTLT